MPSSQQQPKVVQDYLHNELAQGRMLGPLSSSRDLAPSTQKAYTAAMKRFYIFCTTYNISTPFPLSEQSLCSFAAYLADQDLAPQTIKSYLSALCNMQISLRLPDPREQTSLPVLKQIQVGISRTRMLKASPPRIRLPITVHILE